MPDDEIYLCPWRENYWKYDEVKRFLLMYKAQNGGCDLNRIKNMGLYDFVKLAILKEYL